MIEQVYSPLVLGLGLVVFAFSRLNSGLLQYLGLWEESHAPPIEVPRRKRLLLTLPSKIEG